MDVKTDTKEKFTVITPEVEQISANMTGNLQEMLLTYLGKDIPHIIINLQHVAGMEPGVAHMLTNLHKQFYDHGASFIVCCMQKEVERMLDEQGFLELLNVTPTESEAWDIAQMEEIERELMKDFDNNTDS